MSPSGAAGAGAGAAGYYVARSGGRRTFSGPARAPADEWCSHAWYTWDCRGVGDAPWGGECEAWGGGWAGQGWQWDAADPAEGRRTGGPEAPDRSWEPGVRYRDAAGDRVAFLLREGGSVDFAVNGEVALGDLTLVVPEGQGLRLEGTARQAAAPEVLLAHLPAGEEEATAQRILAAVDEARAALPAREESQLVLDSEADLGRAECALGVGYEEEEAAFVFDGRASYARFRRAAADDLTIAFEFATTSSAGRPGGQWFGGCGLVDAESTSPAASVGRRSEVDEADDFGVSVADGRVMFGVGRPDTTIASEARFNDGAWHHVVARRRRASGELRLEVDGVVVGSKVGSTRPLDAGPFLDLGRIGRGKNHFRGRLRRVRVLGRCLEEAGPPRALSAAGLADVEAAIAAAPPMTFGRLLTLCHRLAAAGFEFVVIGGWAVDICSGHESREHKDVDLCVWARDRELLELFLSGPCGCRRVERYSVADGTCKTLFFFADGSYGEAMGMRAAGDYLVLEGRVWQCAVPRAAVGSPIGTQTIHGRPLPIGSAELLVRMQQTWGYRPEDKALVDELAQTCDPELMTAIVCQSKCLGEGSTRTAYRCHIPEDGS